MMNFKIETKIASELKKIENYTHIYDVWLSKLFIILHNDLNKLNLKV